MSTARVHDHDHHHGQGGHSHGLVHDSIKRSRHGLRAVGLSLAILALTAAIQVVVFMSTGSVALLADLIHNSGDALTAIPLGVAFWSSADGRPEHASGGGVDSRHRATQTAPSETATPIGRIASPDGRDGAAAGRIDPSDGAVAGIRNPNCSFRRGDAGGDPANWHVE